MLYIDGESSGTTSITNRRKSRSRTDSSFSSVLNKSFTRRERESTPIVRRLSTPSHIVHTVVMVLLSVFMPSTPSIARAFRAGTFTTAFSHRFSRRTLSFGSLSITRSVFTSIDRRGSEVEHRAKSLFSSSSSSSSSSGTTAINVQTTPTPSSSSDEIPQKRKKKKKKKGASQDLRREFIGKAKAVDRGQWSAVYSPGGDDGVSFEAKSGLPDRSKLFTVLGIESSCDDTGAAVVRSDGVILGESLASQTRIHESFGGVVPGLAREAHLNTIDSVISEALANAGLSSVAEVDGIGVTVGPGLEICLRVGCEKAKGLAMEFNLPFVAVHHLEAHIMMARLPFGEDVGGEGYAALDGGGGILAMERAIEFPFLALLVSGGHCQLLKCLGVGRYEIIGGTIDDSLGEAYDKIARLLSLPIGGGGGPAVESLALEGDPTSIPLPIPLQRRRDCDFSYAGLKTAVRTRAEKLRIERGLESIAELGREDRANIAASFQNAAIKHVEQRLKRAMDGLEKEGTGIRCLAVVGGVAANKELRGRLGRVCEGREEPWRMVVPPAKLCTDQGSMSAWAAIERLSVGSSDVAEGQDVFTRFPFKSNE